MMRMRLWKTYLGSGSVEDTGLLLGDGRHNHRSRLTMRVVTGGTDGISADALPPREDAVIGIHALQGTSRQHPSTDHAATMRHHRLCRRASPEANDASQSTPVCAPVRKGREGPGDQRVRVVRMRRTAKRLIDRSRGARPSYHSRVRNVLSS